MERKSSRKVSVLADHASPARPPALGVLKDASKPMCSLTNKPAALNKRRKNIRLPNQIYELSSQIFSVTICVQGRRPIFKNEKWAKTLLGSLNTGLIAKQTEQYAWCLMPDHFHLLISPRGANLSDIQSAWKSYTAHLLRKVGLDGACWQRGFYDHALRKEEDVQRAAEYIINNPVRKGLVQNWRDYPFSWHKWM
jgi:REP element-mobilizing transposase RayT